ncbi:OmpH family outer membrane protein [Chryseosolibacter indicus]|uniref:OmpH family outer membrane protein n=1 Tax=Chryseosolibacter indicus TaxID=2782351 RepID=A0ABS5VZZ2_9BACT|nr:OmpH family outer membrane protein [Chryseosolibacter indicus]MBT1705601.1 OmpH family outer membrane protein [Chryseosolibacter indicus]
MQRSFIFITVLVLSCSVAVNIYLYLSRPTIAYVRSRDLIEKYSGTIEARAAFERKKSAMLANVDSLEVTLNKAREAFVEEQTSLSSRQQVQRQSELEQQRTRLYQYEEAIDQKIDEEDNKMMSAVLNQINSFVEEYAKENNIDIILGTTLSGSLLYGEQSMDITEQVLSSINNKYKGND